MPLYFLQKVFTPNNLILCTCPLLKNKNETNPGTKLYFITVKQLESSNKTIHNVFGRFRGISPFSTYSDAHPPKFHRHQRLASCPSLTRCAFSPCKVFDAFVVCWQQSAEKKNKNKQKHQSWKTKKIQCQELNENIVKKKNPKTPPEKINGVLLVAKLSAEN